MKVLVPFGTRPEVIKLAPVVRALRERGVEVRTLATGQHFEPAMSSSLWTELGLVPDASRELPEDEAARAGAIVALAAAELRRPYDLVLVLGDTHTVPAFALAARARRVPVAHVEAGLRSFNETSLEEVNRRIAAATASLHFAPTLLAAEFLLAEGVAPERIHVVGNPGIDAAVATGVARVPPPQRHGILFTAHRATNVDDPQQLERLLRFLVTLAREVGDVTFPVHPRTRARLAAIGAFERLDREGVAFVEPLGYRETLERVASSRLVVTDSGGLQEDAAWLGVPAVVLRRSTPRWEAVLAGGARLVGLDLGRALEAVRELSTEAEQERVAALPCPFGDGHAAERIAGALLDPATVLLLHLDDPDYGRRTPPGAIEAVLFDLDDTLYPQQAWLDGAWRAVAAHASTYGVDGCELYAALGRIAGEGSGRGRIIDRALAELGAADVPVAELVDVFRSFRPVGLDPYPGVREALAELRRSVPIGLVTDGDPDLQRAKLAALGLEDAFDVVVCSDELGPLGRKPAPAAFRAALDRLGVAPGHAAYVGDNPDKDVAGPLATGLLPVRVLAGEYADVADSLPHWRRAESAVAAIELLQPLLAARARVEVTV